MKLLVLSLILSLSSFIKANSQDGFVKGEPFLAYWKVEAKGEIIIVLHGGPSAPHHYLRPEFDALKEVGTIVYYDQRGCGKSLDASSYTWQEHLKDLKRVKNTFSKDKKVVLAGSSWGSLLAILFAYYYPEDVKGMILSGTVEWTGKEMNAQDYALYRLGKLTPVAPKVYRWKMQEERAVISNEPDSSATEKTIPVEKEYEYFVGGYKGETLVSLVTAPNLIKLKQIKIPVLIFNGSRRDCGLEDWGHTYANKFSNSVLKTIRGACHDPWFSNPKYFFSESSKFIFGLISNNEK